MAFLVLGLHQYGRRKGRRGWLQWIAWVGGLLLVFATVRAAILTILAAFVPLFLFRPLRDWVKPLSLLILVGAIVGLFAVLNTNINIGGERHISAEQVALNLQSILGPTQEQTLDGTREWRLLWWKTILAYTVYGEYFWTGKGFGTNLATDDGFQGFADESLRSPHNAHLTILARSGVPGFLFWVALQLGFAGALVRAYTRARLAHRGAWMRLNLWILIYWAAFMVNGAFDVFLEGPQGGIWFWSLFGFGIAALQVQGRRSREALDGERT
jgi:O-antigen ligase